MRVACALLAGLTLAWCSGCRRPLHTVASEPRSVPALEPPFMVLDQPPPRAHRKLAVWDDRVWLMADDGRQAWPLPTGGRIIARRGGETRCHMVVAWSPDRKRIAYLREDTGQTLGEASLRESSWGRSPHGPSGTVWIIDAEGSPPVRLADLREIGRIAWSPDGCLLAASGTHRSMGPRAEASEHGTEQGGAEPGLVENVDVGLWLIHVQENWAKLLHHAHTGNGDVGTYFGLHWSPDSHTIAAITPDASCEGDRGPSATLADVETGKVQAYGRDQQGFPQWLREELGPEPPATGVRALDEGIIDLGPEPPGA